MYTLIEAVTPYLSEIEKAMLSLTCNWMYENVGRKYSLIDSCIVSKDLRMLNIVEKWGNRWNNESYRLLGSTDGIGLLMVYFQRFNVEQLEVIAEASIFSNSKKTLSFLWKTRITRRQDYASSDIVRVDGNRLREIIEMAIVNDRSLLKQLAQKSKLRRHDFCQCLFGLACKYRDFEACSYICEINCNTIFSTHNREDYDWINPYYEVRLLEVRQG